MSTITSLHHVLESNDSQTLDNPHNSSKIKGILYRKIQNFSKLLDEHIQVTNNRELETEYIDFKESLNLEVSDVVKNFRSNKSENIFLKTQKWMGHIVEISNQTIFAKLEDFNDPTTHEIGEFEIDDIPYEDRELICIGAGFYFSLGHAYDKNGQIEKKSLIRFQRANPWDEYSFNSIIDEADNLYEKLKWE